jgi:hypothetical protein
MKPIITKKTVHFEINGKKYDRIEDVPPEFREMVRVMSDNPEAFRNSSVTKVTSSFNIDLSGEVEGKPAGDYREKFLRESVLPNLHLLDPKAQAEVLRALGGDTEKQPSSRGTLLRIVLYALLGIVLIFGFSALKKVLFEP